MPVSFVTEPAAYRHWRLELDGPIATMVDGRRPGRRASATTTS